MREMLCVGMLVGLVSFMFARYFFWVGYLMGQKDERLKEEARR